MEWISIPLELFATIIVKLDLVSIVRLEQVCKSFQENLKNQNIWKEIALRDVPSYNSVPETENWRHLALTRFDIRLNMREKRCLLRSIQTKESLGPYNVMTHSCSVAGNEALITLINEAQNYSYSTTNFIAHELVNLTTGERKLLDGNANRPNALLTRNYIVTASGYVTHQVAYANPNLEVLDRKSGKKFNITIHKLDPNAVAKMQQNEDENYDTICVNAGTNFHVVDLKERTSSCFRITNEDTSDGQNIPFQFYGKYIAYSRKLQTYALSGKGKLRLTVIDIDTGKQVFFEQSEDLLDWAIADNKVFFGSHTENGVKWVLKNFKGEILHQYNLNVPTSHFYDQSGVRIFEHVILYFKRTQMYFFDVYNGEFLCSLELFGISEYGSSPYLRAISPGKFIYSEKHTTRLIDFESRFITKPIKVKILSPDNCINTLPSDVHEPIPFNELAKFTEVIAEVPALDSSFYWSICVSQTKRKRVSMFCCNDVIKKPHNGKTQQENAAASKLIRKEKKLRMYSSISMNSTEFRDERLRELKGDSTFSIKPGDTVRDHVVLYNEVFMNGEWVPVDYEEDITRAM